MGKYWIRSAQSLLPSTRQEEALYLLGRCHVLKNRVEDNSSNTVTVNKRIFDAKHSSEPASGFASDWLQLCSQSEANPEAGSEENRKMKPVQC